MEAACRGGGMIVLKRIILVILLGIPAIDMSSGPAHADDPDFLTIAGGWFDFNRQKDQGGEFRVDYRSNYKLGHFKPFLTFAKVTNGMTFIGGGILLDVFLGNRFVLTPSIAPTYWRGKTNDLDLGHGFELRSQIELAYRFNDRSRLGLAISHTSNASLGDTNPGTESFQVNYSHPLGNIIGP